VFLSIKSQNRDPAALYQLMSSETIAPQTRKLSSSLLRFTTERFELGTFVHATTAYADDDVL